MLVTIIPGVQAEILTPDTSVICRGDTLKLQASGGVGSAFYQWWPAAGLSHTQSSITYASPEQHTRYYVAVSEAGCEDTAYWDVFVHPRPDAAFSISQAQGCAPLEIHTQNLSSQGYSYEWKVSGTSFHSNEPEPLIRFDLPGVYSIHLIVRGMGGCIDSMTHPLPIQVGEQAEIIAASEPPAPVELSLPMAPIRLIDYTPDVEKRIWHLSDGNAEHADTVYRKWHSPGTYYVNLYIRTFYGCEATRELGPFIVRNPTLFIPNVFSPNNDGVHDRFVIEYDGDELYWLQVMDRWGSKVFETHHPNETWDGRGPGGAVLSESVYFYILQIGEKEYAGSVTLVR
jgi:gliding motility-associated-like protein